jgi:hypothetical protein
VTREEAQALEPGDVVRCISADKTLPATGHLFEVVGAYTDGSRLDTFMGCVVRAVEPEVDVAIRAEHRLTPTQKLWLAPETMELVVGRRARLLKAIDELKKVAGA